MRLGVPARSPGGFPGRRFILRVLAGISLIFMLCFAAPAANAYSDASPLSVEFLADEPIETSGLSIRIDVWATVVCGDASACESTKNDNDVRWAFRAGGDEFANTGGGDLLARGTLGGLLLVAGGGLLLATRRRVAN